jgi:hypothetical protein
MRGFIRSYVPASTISGKLARWIDPICPLVIGLSPNENMAVRERIKKDAQAVGAPLQARQSCRPNVIAVFVQDPQALTTMIATQDWSKAKILLGDVDGPMHARKLSKITSAIQAWYGTGIKDMEGRRAPNECWPTRCELIAKASNLDDGTQSFFAHVFVVIDLSKVAGRQIGTIADYAAMLILTQTDAFATCRNMPSITNLLMPECDTNLKTAALSDADLADLAEIEFNIKDPVRVRSQLPALPHVIDQRHAVDGGLNLQPLAFDCIKARIEQRVGSDLQLVPAPHVVHQRHAIGVIGSARRTWRQLSLRRIEAVAEQVVRLVAGRVIDQIMYQGALPPERPRRPSIVNWVE